MKTLFSFFRDIISAESDASSKRLIAVWFAFVVTGIVTYALWKGEVHETIITIFQALLWLIGALAGIGTAQAIGKHVGNRPNDR